MLDKMFVTNLCHTCTKRATTAKSVFLNLVMKTSAAGSIRKGSSDSTKSGDENDSRQDMTKNAKDKSKSKPAKKLFVDTTVPNADEIIKQKIYKLISEVKEKNKVLESETAPTETNAQIPRPQSRRKPKKSDEVHGKRLKKDLIESAKYVAKDLGGNTKQTENELLQILNTFMEPKEKPDVSVRSDATEVEKPVVQLSPEMKNSAEKIQSIVQGINLVEKSVRKRRPMNFNDERQSQWKWQLEYFENVGNLEIFSTDAKEWDEGAKLMLWNDLEEDYLKHITTYSPRNYFEELIQWTEQGKLWHFPINNEQGMDEEAKVGFEEHIFLDVHLEPWCPKNGPLRHFMELVLVGLSKNHYLTVSEKKEHIYWFRDYFENKKKLLTEIGAFSKKATINQE